MTDNQAHGDDDSITARIERLETIIARLEDDDVSLEQAQQLHNEGERLLRDLEDEFDLGESEVIERV
ncbi:exodeoxyribonuclease VII small subunit [Haloquadratum walsbyi]|jgi:exodeoxyribonuclease VII small subunit|uniref:Exonuclease VII small subunit n=1 Tax=Haloquadratum walsbyi J07HQW2 TaxID=1238425 RepID=U1N2K0_9EURY|nr:exodeoxyribonuclease VII small subunit [Haloquadratum walsbyi]ERG97109.1 MAG: Exonuclease VII small subunit [Haloquadratum walsbyi J07HQW2]